MIAIDRMRNRTALRSMASERGFAGQVPAGGCGPVLTAPDRIRPRAAGDSAGVGGAPATRRGPRRDGPPPRSRTPSRLEGSDTAAQAAARRPCDTPTTAPGTRSRRDCGGIDSRKKAAGSSLSGLLPVAEQRGDSLGQHDGRPSLYRCAGQQEPIPSGRHRVGMRANHFPQPALDPVTLDRPAELTTHDHADPTDLLPRFLAHADEGQRSPRQPLSLIKDLSDLDTTGDSRHAADYTVRRFLPLARRRFKTRRPSVVDMRLRNPCVRLRRNLLGCLIVTDIDVHSRACYFRKSAIL